MKQFRLIILIGLTGLFSFSNKEENGLTFVKINGKDVPKLNISEIKDTLSFSLSQLLYNPSFIKLETSDENKLARGIWAIGKKYIVGYCRQLGFFQFTSNGKFLRKIANYGKGPQDVSYPTWTISKDESRLYIYDRLKPKSFLCFNLNSGLFERSIPIALTGQLKNIYTINDSILICSPVVGTGEPAGSFYVFWQNISGKFINGIPARIITRPNVPAENIMYRVGNNFHYKPVYCDTIFQVNGFKISPCFIFKINKQNIGNEDDIGQTTITILAETPDFILIQGYTITKKNMIGENSVGYTGKEKYYYIDKLNKRPYIISSFYNDFTGEKVSQLITFEFEYQTSALKYVSIDAVALLKQIEKIKSHPNIRILNRDTFINLEKVMTLNDNPVLLVGKLTKD